MSLTAAIRHLGIALVLALGAALMAVAPANAADPDVRAPDDGEAPTKPVIRYDDGPVLVGDEARASYSLHGNAWTGTSLTYGFTNTTPDLGESATKAEVAGAFALWADSSGLDFTEVADCGIAVPPGAAGCSTPDIRILFDGAGHGSDFGSSGGVLAHAYYPPPNGGTLAGDAHFDEGDDWAGIDLLTVAAHEFGHSLGLAHAERAQCPSGTGEYALMCPFYIGPHRYLGSDDVAAIQSLYGEGGPPPPPPPAPANDDFADAEALVDPSGSTSTSSVNATKEAGEPTHAGDSGGHSVWYSWVAPEDGTLRVDTFSSGFDTLLGVYTGGAVDSLVEEVASDDTTNPESLQSEVAFDVVGGTTYRIAVDGYGGHAGTVALRWQFEPPPEPTHQPDGRIKRSSGSYVGDDVYNTTGAGQSRSARVRRGAKATFWVRVQNDGTAVEDFTVRGTRNNERWWVSYYAGTKNISAAVRAGNHRVSSLQPTKTALIRVVITARQSSRKGNRKAVAVTAGSVTEPTVKDTVKAIVRRR